MAEDSREPKMDHAQRAKRRTRPAAKRKASHEPQQHEETKRRRAFADFFSFCNFVLAYEEQLALNPQVCAPKPVDQQQPPPPVLASPRQPSLAEQPSRHSAGESSSSSSSSPSNSSSSDSSDGEEGFGHEQLEYTSDDESWNLVTCFCRRPFAGRPMVECAACQTWIHLFCVNLKKSQVPDVYICPQCSGKETKPPAEP